MSSFSVAGLQISLVAQDNQDQLERETEKFLKIFPWVQMVVFGELAALGHERKFAETLPGPTERRFCQLAKKHRIWLIPGSLYEKSDSRIFNTTSVINPDGEVVARYRKRFPFLPYETGITPGSDAVVFDVPKVGRFGISICYDQWFPEVARELSWKGAEVIINPTMTGTIDRAQELVIAQANAIFNQCYYININNAGSLGNGRSICIGPEGDILHQAGEQTEFIPLTLDLERVRRVRSKGSKGLGQPLKSFRDFPANFSCYGATRTPSPWMEELGPLTLP